MHGGPQGAGKKRRWKALGGGFRAEGISEYAARGVSAAKIETGHLQLVWAGYRARLSKGQSGRRLAESACSGSHSPISLTP